MSKPPENFHDGTPVYFNLKSANLISAQESATPEGFYIEGEINENNFSPRGDILGQGDLATGTGRYGWLELNSKQFFPMESSQKAKVPFVKGYNRDDGFYPSDRKVFNTP